MSQDVLIVGAGPLGCALALALHRFGISPRVVDARAGERADSRILALSEGSRQILSRLCSFPSRATSIARIHISQQGGFGRTLIDAKEYGLPALGHVLPAAALTEALREACERAGIAIEYGVNVGHIQAATDHAIAHVIEDNAGNEARTLRARLVIRAEGSVDDTADATTRDYQQDAIVCLARPDQPHGNLAFERFTASGPFALLPCGEAYSVVVTARRVEADALMAASDADFLATVNAAFSGRVSLQDAGPRARYPLTLRYRKTIAAERTVWLGNAAQTLHPVAGQGFNLALRDAWSLAEWVNESRADPGSEALLARYAAGRRLDRCGTIGFTDALIRVFANDDPLLRVVRGAGLAALDCLPGLRRFVASRMMLGARGW